MKLTIVHTTGDRSGTSQSVDGKEVIALGRRPGNDIVFDQTGDVTVSGHHADIRIVDGHAHIVDMQSTNGTFVNGQRVNQAKLEPNDEVVLGDKGPGFKVTYTKPAVEPQGDEQAGDKIYGQRTVGVMIQQALDEAGKEQAKGTSKSTEYFEALMDKKVKRSSSRLKKIVISSIIAFVVIGIGLGIYFYFNRSVQVYQTTQVSYGDKAGGNIAAANRYAVFMIAGTPKSRPKQTSLQGFCTGFAIRPDLLATNAHCVKGARAKFSTVYALMNGSPQHRYPVVQMLAHPSYSDGSISPDVGLMKIKGQLTNLVTISPHAELGQVAPGVSVFLYGFPGRLNKEEAPEATFIKGEIGRVTNFDQKLGNFGSNTLLQHSAFCTGGTSGSPMFNGSGHVIGINAGGYTENGQALAGYNFGMRADLLNPLLARMGYQ